MTTRTLSDEQLRKLSPEERIKYLRALEAQQKKEAEEARKKAEEEIAAAEELIKRSEEEMEEEEAQIAKAQEEKEGEAVPEKEEESLEERLAKENARSTTSGQYRTDKPYEPPGQERNESGALYQTLEGAARDLDRLYRTTEWSGDDERAYREAKERVERAATYQLQSDRLREDLGVAKDFLNRLHYRT